MAMNGMLSVNYPPIYRNFAKNFAFSTGAFPWDDLQRGIDNFRNLTGGNLTESSITVLRNTNLIHANEEPKSDSPAKRALDTLLGYALAARDELNTSVDTTPPPEQSGTPEPEPTMQNKFVQGIQAYVEELSIPEANTFMTVLLIFAIVVASIAVGILLLKVVLEFWALRGSFPKKLTNFRKDYWGYLGRTVTNLILILYGIWTLYCVFQFTRGDSWAAKLLAGFTLGIFTIVLGFFTFKIWRVAHKAKKRDGDTSALFDDKETWRKYSLFYDHYKRGYWWIFVPLIVYMFARGCIIAAGDGHGLVQSSGQLIVEGLLLILLLWTRPFETKTSQWISISIQVVRVLSVCCILVFVHEFGISQTTQTVTGLALIIVQSTLTGLLVILMAVNAFVLCFGKNPHEERHKATLAGKSTKTQKLVNQYEVRANANIQIQKRNQSVISTISLPSMPATRCSSTHLTAVTPYQRSASSTTWAITNRTATCLLNLNTAVPVVPIAWLPTPPGFRTRGIRVGTATLAAFRLSVTR